VKWWCWLNKLNRCSKKLYKMREKEVHAWSPSMTISCAIHVKKQENLCKKKKFQNLDNDLCNKTKGNKGCVTLWPCHLHSKYLRKKKNYEIQIFHHAKIWFKQKSSKETKIFQHIITLYLISSFNTSKNIIFWKSLNENRPTT